MADPASTPDLSGSVGALSAALLGAALDVAGLAVVMTDAPLDAPGPIIRYANAHFEAITGYPAAELLGRSPRLLQGPDTDPNELRRLRRALDETGHFIGATINYRKDGSPYLNEWVVTPILAPDGRVTHWFSIQRDSTIPGVPHPGAEALQRRTEALLASVRAIASRSLAGEEDRSFGDRLAALGRAQALAAGPGAKLGADLAALLRGEIDQLSPAPGQVTIEGPPVPLPRGVAEPLSLALYELAANAARHGALATPEGHLTVTWRLDGAGSERRLYIAWHERGTAGPRPEHGWRVIEEALAFALGGETRLETGPDGLTCTIVLPLAG
ncbi:PAS domain-containing protein [Roseomonas sp. WA12]